MMAIWELVAKLFAFGLSTYLEHHAASEEARKDYLIFLDIMQKKGLVSVKMRLKAIDQMNRVKDLWEKEKNESNSKPTA